MREGTRAEHFFGSTAELEAAIDQAEGCCQNQWENEFVAGMSARFEKYGAEMFLSEKQAEILKRIADR